MFKQSKKAQAWGMDITVAIVIFIVGLVVVYIYSINLSSEAQETLDTLAYQGNIISSTMLLEGTPTNWQESPDSVLIPGLLTQGKIDENKLSNFSDLMENHPSLLKSKLNTKYNFCMNISDYPTYCTASMPSEDNIHNLVRVQRYVAYQNVPSIMEIRIWD